MPTWLLRMLGPGLDLLNAAAEGKKAFDVGITPKQSMRRGIAIGVTANPAFFSLPTAALVSTPGSFRMAAQQKKENPDAPFIGLGPLRGGRVPTAETIEKVANVADFLDPTAYAGRFADETNPQLKDAPEFSMNPNERMEQIKNYLLKNAQK